MDTDGILIEPEDGMASSKATKSQLLAAYLRQQIIDRKIVSNRIASYQELEKTYRVSRAVVREAVSQLKREGFIHSVDRKGLYVSEFSPLLNRFALVFSHNPSFIEWPRFFTALQQEATGFAREHPEISFVNYYDVACGPGSEGYDRLYDDARSQRLAGLLLAAPGHELGQTEPFKSSEIPKLYICGSTEEGHVPSVTTDHAQMCRRMVEWLGRQGRKRIAVVAMWGNHVRAQELLSQFGVPYRPHWFQTLGRDNITEVRKVVSLLMDYSPDQRPDGLIILDDTLTEHAIGGLLQSEVRIGKDIDVIAHCNWPWPVASPVPIRRIGFHARHLVGLSVRAIQLMRGNHPLATEQVKIPALFEDELHLPWKADAFDNAAS